MLLFFKEVCKGTIEVSDVTFKELVYCCGGRYRRRRRSRKCLDAMKINPNCTRVGNLTPHFK